MCRVAILFRGGVSSKNGKINLTNFNDNYVNFKCVYNSIKKHIIDVNSDYEFDFFIHSWSYQLKDELNKLYNPVVSNYEDNLLYHSMINDKLILCNSGKNLFSSASEALSYSKTSKLFLEYSEINSINYDFVIIYRPDVLIWKDLILSEYCEDVIYCNSFLDDNGGFHFVFDPKKIYGFIDIFDGLSKFNPPYPHFFIKNHLMSKHNFKVMNDNIVAGQHQEVVRKLNLLEIDKEFLTEYGITLDEVKTYNPY